MTEVLRDESATMKRLKQPAAVLLMTWQKRGSKIHRRLNNWHDRHQEKIVRKAVRQAEVVMTNMGTCNV